MLRVPPRAPARSMKPVGVGPLPVTVIVTSSGDRVLGELTAGVIVTVGFRAVTVSVAEPVADW